MDNDSRFRTHGVDSVRCSLGRGRPLWPKLQSRRTLTPFGAIIASQRAAWRQRMAHFERIRDIVTGPVAATIMQERAAAGWQLVSMEWRREHPGDGSPSAGPFYV